MCIKWYIILYRLIPPINLLFYSNKIIILIKKILYKVYKWEGYIILYRLIPPIDLLFYSNYIVIFIKKILNKSI